MKSMYVVTADEGKYLTQKAEVSEEERDYVLEVCSADPNVASLWRDATEEEYDEWSKRMAEYEAQQQETVEEQGNE